MLVIMCNDRPGYGGAATNAYNIMKSFPSSRGIFVNCNPLYEIDPDGIGRVHHCYEYIFNNGYENLVKKYAMSLNFKPSLVLCKNSTTVTYAKKLWPSVKVVYLCPGANGMIEISGTGFVISVDDCEKRAVEQADVIVFNGECTRNIFLQIFPQYEDKVYEHIVDTTSVHSDYPIYDCVKIYDIIIAASILTRPEKNNLFLIDILANTSASKVIVGNENDAFLEIPNATIYDLVPHEQLLWLLSQSKVLLFPSIYDSNPSTIREALHYGCKVLVSSNLDISKRLPKEYVCETFEHKEWDEKLKYLLNSNMTFTLDSNQYTIEQLIDNM